MHTHRRALRRPSAVLLLVLAAATGCSQDPTGDTAAPESSTSPSSRTSPTSTPVVEADEPEQPVYVQYAGGESRGITLRRSSDARLLEGAPKDFRAWVAGYVDRLAEQNEVEGCDVATTVTVASVRSDGYADGSITACGGYRALWAVVDGAWQEVAGTQEQWPCTPLRRYEVPDEVVGTECLDERGRTRPYAQP